MTEHSPSIEQASPLEPSQSTVDAIARAYLSAGMEGICTGFGANDPLLLKSALRRIAREDISKPTDHQIEALIDRTTEIINAAGGVDDYLDERYREATENTTVSQTDVGEYATPSPEATPDERSDGGLGKSVVARFFRGQR